MECQSVNKTPAHRVSIHAKPGLSFVVLPPLDPSHLRRLLYSLARQCAKKEFPAEVIVLDEGEGKEWAKQALRDFKPAWPWVYLIPREDSLTSGEIISHRPLFLPCDAILTGDITQRIADHPEESGEVDTYLLPPEHALRLDPYAPAIAQPALAAAFQNPVVSPSRCVRWGLTPPAVRFSYEGGYVLRTEGTPLPKLAPAFQLEEKHPCLS